MQPKLLTRGQAPTAMDLEDKKKVDQDLFTAVINKYNSSNNLYSCHAFLHIDNFMDIGLFDVCQPHEWKKAWKKFGDLIAEYEVLCNRWTRSGFHGNFNTMMDEAIAHSEDNTNPAMLYLHEYLAGFKNHKFFDICMGFLTSNTFL
jgi:hypothetical protein